MPNQNTSYLKIRISPTKIRLAKSKIRSYLAVTTEIRDMMEQIPDEWDPHQRLEFFKVAIRTTVAEDVGRDRGELRRSIKMV